MDIVYPRSKSRGPWLMSDRVPSCRRARRWERFSGRTERRGSSQPAQQGDQDRTLVSVQRRERFIGDAHSDRRGSIVEVRACGRQRHDDAATIVRIWPDGGELARGQAIDDSLDRRGVHRRQATKTILRTIADFPQFRERGPLGRREVLDHPGGENRSVTLLRLTQRKTPLFIEDVGLLPIAAALKGGALHLCTRYHSHEGLA